MIVERLDVKQAIESHLPQLRTTLSDQGVTIHAFTVSVGDDLRHFQERPDRPYQDYQHRQSQSSSRHVNDEPREDRPPRRRFDADRVIDYFA
jgi:flagellar hook-length control protein FliK